jgi:dihydroorotase
MKKIEIIKPDDWHVHFRDGEMMKAVVPETSKHFARAIVMPNLIPPILTGKDALRYKDDIQKAIPFNHDFEPLMTIYLTEETNKNDLENSYINGDIFAAKLYPAGATTNSESGVKNINLIMPLLEKMSEIGMPLLIHGEVTDKNIDIFDREKIFIENILTPICQNFPKLKITLEHITTEDAVSFVLKSNKNVVASITPHHLSLNRNAILVGGINPHYYCLPVLKREKHRIALVEAALSDNEKFFLGTDSAPHSIKSKETSCGCAGVFNSSNSISVVTEIFDQNKSLSKLESFLSLNGPKHYGLKNNNSKIKIVKNELPLKFPETLKFQNENIVIFKPNFPLFWEVVF